jgi:hypothetical protein
MEWASAQSAEKTEGARWDAIFGRCDLSFGQPVSSAFADSAERVIVGPESGRCQVGRDLWTLRSVLRAACLPRVRGLG